MLHNVGSCCTLATEGLYTCAALVSHTVCSSSKYNLADGTQSKESNTLVPTPNTNWGGLGVFHSIALAFQTFLAHQATKGKVGYISEVASENTRIQRSEIWTWPKKPNNYRHYRSGNLRSNTLTEKAWKLTNWRLWILSAWTLSWTRKGICCHAPKHAARTPFPSPAVKPRCERFELPWQLLWPAQPSLHHWSQRVSSLLAKQILDSWSSV